MRVWAFVLLFGFGLCSCSQTSLGGAPGGYGPQRVNTLSRAARMRGHAQSPIQHIVIIVQENRSVDNLFQLLPGANTQSYGFASHGNRHIQLEPQSLAAPFDLGHGHPNWVTSTPTGQ